LLSNDNSRQVVHTHVPLSSNNTTWYWSTQVNYSTQLKFIRNKVARRLKDTHENNDDKETNKTIKQSKNNNSNRDMFKSQYSAE